MPVTTVNICPMTKTEAIRLFGDTQVALAEALRVTRACISRWPEDLGQERTDRIVGAAIRLGRLVPKAETTVVLSPPAEPPETVQQ